MIRYKSIDEILTRLVKEDSRVLEIGSNGEPGYLDHIPNLDILRTNVVNLPGIQKIVDAQKPLPFPDLSYDLVFLVATDYYIQNIEEMFSEISRVLTSGGYFVNATYKVSNLKWQVANQPHAFHAKNWSEYKQIYDRLSFDSHYEVALNNRPHNPVKKLVWEFTPSFLLKLKSQWRVHICQKSNR